MERVVEYPAEYSEFLKGMGLEALLPKLGQAVEQKRSGVFIQALPDDVQLLRLDRLPEAGDVQFSAFPWKKHTHENPDWLALWKPPFVIKDFSYGYRSSDILDMQRMLKRLGYYWGPVDGMVGPLTWRAINTFQKDMKLKRTMWPDRRPFSG